MSQRAQADALFQLIHRVDVIHPAVINHSQQDHLFDLTHVCGTDFRFLFVVQMSESLNNICFQFLGIQTLQFLLRIVHAAETVGQSREILVEQLKIPFLRELAVHRNWYNDIMNELFHHFHDGFLQILTKQNLAALIINDLSLLIHNIIVLQNVFTDLKVAALNLLLRVFDRLGKHPRRDRFILHAEFFHNPLHAFSAEQTH